MIMTYAAQVRSVSKAVSSQHTDEDFYDINSLRIICKYFVGSTVSVKTADEVIEGVLHTIFHNKICLSLVTTTKLIDPEKITEISPNKMINLSEVLLISTKGMDVLEVTVEGKYIKAEQEASKSQKLLNNNKSSKKSVEPLHDVQKIGQNIDEPAEKLTIIENQTENEPVEKQVKKTFAFNPNAPEFKPRSNTGSYTEPGNHMLFAGHQLPQGSSFSPVFSPNSAPAIFVPNLFFYAPPSPNQPHQMNGNNHNLDQQSYDNNFDGNIANKNTHDAISTSISDDSKYCRKSISDLHMAASSTLSFPQMLPIFPPPLPIFVPNHSFKFGTLPFGNTVDIASSHDDEMEEVSVEENINDKNHVKQHSSNIELSNPSIWPPLPLPGNQQQSNNSSKTTPSSQQ